MMSNTRIQKQLLYADLSPSKLKTGVQSKCHKDRLIAMVNMYEVDLQWETRVDDRVYGGHTGVIVLQTLSG